MRRAYRPLRCGDDVDKTAFKAMSVRRCLSTPSSSSRKLKAVRGRWQTGAPVGRQPADSTEIDGDAPIKTYIGMPYPAGNVKPHVASTIIVENVVRARRAESRQMELAILRRRRPRLVRQLPHVQPIHQSHIPKRRNTPTRTARLRKDPDSRWIDIHEGQLDTDS